MKRHPIVRGLLGVVAASPLLVFALIGTLLIWGPSSSLPMGTIVIVSVLTSIGLHGATVGYFLYLVRTDARLDSSEKARWTSVLMHWFPFAAISYWYHFVWRDHPTGE